MSKNDNLFIYSYKLKKTKLIEQRNCCILTGKVSGLSRVIFPVWYFLCSHEALVLKMQLRLGILTKRWKLNFTQRSSYDT